MPDILPLVTESDEENLPKSSLYTRHMDIWCREAGAVSHLDQEAAWLSHNYSCEPQGLAAWFQVNIALY